MASFRQQCCAANTRDQDRRQSGVTCTQRTTPNGPVHTAAQHGSGHPGLQHSAPTSYPTSGLGRVKTARVTNCAVLVFLGTKPCAINNREYFSSEKIRRLHLYLFFRLPTQAIITSSALPAAPKSPAPLCFLQSPHLSHNQSSQLRLYSQASTYSNPWQDPI